MGAAEAADIAKHLSTQYGLVGVLIAVLIGVLAGMSFLIWWLVRSQRAADKEGRDAYQADLREVRTLYQKDLKDAREQMQTLVNRMLLSIEAQTAAMGDIAKEMAVQRERCERGSGWQMPTVQADPPKRRGQ